MSDHLIFHKSHPGKIGYSLPSLDVPEVSPSDVVGSEFLRKKELHLPEVTEPEVVRHYTNLSTKNHHVDKDVYPLGSCTMKYNPKVNDAMANLTGFSLVHPNQLMKTVQGALAVISGLEEQLKAITGMSRFTLQPSAGSQGELVGILIMHKYHELQGNQKKTILIPDTAHGTNPASVTMAGYEAVQVRSNKKGRVDIEDLKNKLTDNVAGMMLTQPNTLGLFENDILEITRMVHEAGGLMYMDGANLNAILGLVRPMDMGFDIVHINLHKTFSTPHGGGGPGSGPIGVVENLVKFLPIPLIDEKDGQYYINDDLPNSIGRVHTYFGNFGILVRAYTYILLLGIEGIRTISRQAILNANYLKARVKNAYDLFQDDHCMHEFVLTAVKQKKAGVKALDIGKRLLDYGFHAPTVYFPINVPEAMMVEPTESESVESLDRFADALIKIDDEAKNNPDLLKNAPYSTPVRRLDEVTANRSLTLRWTPDLEG
ncbi:MAG: aminomethyl-transferring glycine dehydrogenase subunit GcvPB [Candidatus Marinimicrobia bacterium]|nr:aminomethyl-transferring glycine dehydrogenase subunit GcvPB [Candidatus Neomarinimicrobiota bacterium]